MLDYKFFYWGPFLFKTKVSDDLLNDIKNIGQNSTQSHTEHLAGQIVDSRKIDIENINILREKIDLYIAGYTNALCNNWVGKKYLNSDTSFELDVVNFWINYQKSFEYNPVHSHDGDISFVIYLDIPKEIKLETNNTTSPPPGSITFIHGNITTGAEKHTIKNALQPVWAQNILPETGDMLIFPSYLLHDVIHFKTPGVTRISMSGNYRIIEGN